MTWCGELKIVRTIVVSNACASDGTSIRPLFRPLSYSRSALRARLIHGKILQASHVRSSLCQRVYQVHAQLKRRLLHVPTPVTRPVRILGATGTGTRFPNRDPGIPYYGRSCSREAIASFSVPIGCFPSKWRITGEGEDEPNGQRRRNAPANLM